MDKSSLFHLISTYRKLLLDSGARPLQVDPTKKLSRDEVLGHCLWVLEEKMSPLLNRIGGFQEALRLIGCIQGTTMAYGLCTIAETRQHANAAKLATWDQIVGEPAFPAPTIRET